MALLVLRLYFIFYCLWSIIVAEEIPTSRTDGSRSGEISQKSTLICKVKSLFANVNSLLHFDVSRYLKHSKVDQVFILRLVFVVGRGHNCPTRPY